MARTQAADFGEKREHIMVGAARIFARNGFAGASVSDIAETCEISKSLLYHYFPSKEAILFAVMQAHIGDLLEVRAECRTVAPARDRFLAITRSLLSRYAGAANAQKVLLYELDSLSPAEKTEIVGGQRRLIDYVEGALADARALLAKDPARLRVTVMLYFGMLNWSHTWFDPQGRISRDELARTVVETMLSSGE